jgi:hypothetical protein
MRVKKSEKEGKEEKEQQLQGVLMKTGLEKQR